MKIIGGGGKDKFFRNFFRDHHRGVKRFISFSCVGGYVASQFYCNSRDNPYDMKQFRYNFILAIFLSVHKFHVCSLCSV